MPRKKEKLFYVETQEEDTLREHNNYLLNFVSPEKILYQSFHACEKRNLFGSDEAKKDLQVLLNDKEKKPYYPIDQETVFIGEISLSGKLKPSDEYLYHLIDTNDKKEVFISFNDVLTYIKKKIKNKYVFLHYNGINERIEFSEEKVKTVIKEMTENTHVISLNQINGKGEEQEPIIITPLKIMK